MSEASTLKVDKLLAALHNAGTPGRKPVQLPAISDQRGQPLSRYAVEKVIGLRRDNGAHKLSRLTHRHYKIIGMHLEGKSMEQVAAAMHISFNTVSRVLNDPLAQTILRRVYNHREEEINALAGPAIDAIRKTLTGDTSDAMKLRAVDRFVKVRETMVNKEKGRETAEDVIARMLGRTTIIAENVQMNFGAKESDNETP